MTSGPTSGSARPQVRRPHISLLHATYRRAGGPLEVRDAWLGRADEPNSIEYVVSMDADDVATVALTEGLPRLVNPAGEGEVTAVRNWNAAAAAAKGDLLVVIADDLFPPVGWDRALLDVIGSLNPVQTPFAVKVADGAPSGDVLLRHPVVSRAFYTRFGLFSPAYRGVYCDDDITARAFWHSVILDGRSVRLEHRHPDMTDEVAPSESQDRLNRCDEYERGRAAYARAWSRRERSARPRLVPTDRRRPSSHHGLIMTQRKLRAYSTVRYGADLVGRLLCPPRARYLVKAMRFRIRRVLQRMPESASASR